MTSAFDVVIVGAGIAGSACAREFAEAGVQVAIVERNAPGGGATAAGMGHIVVMDDSPAQLALTHYSRSLWQKLIPELPPSVEYEERGTLWIAADEEEMTHVHAKQSLYAQPGIRSEVLDAAALSEAEPHLRAGLVGALRVPDDAVLYPPAAALFFLEAAQRAGAELIRGAVVSASGGAVTLTDGTTLASDHIVIATGADMSIAPWVRLKQRKGHLVITDRYPGFARHQLVELGYLKTAHSIASDSVAFNVQPRITGQLLIGSSRQYGQEDATVDASIVARMLHRACQYMPQLASLSAIRVWTGFRAATSDNLPLIGPTRDPTLYLLAGFEGLGITLATGAARLLVDHLLGRQPAIDPTPYLPQRMLRTEAIHA
ncbi:MAG TPA: FAD-dependent oxidoreductase [Acidobacteriaceae bacterium]